MLSALVSGLIQADFLIMLTDINGLYDKNPAHFTDAKRYDRLPTITDSILDQTKDEAGSKVGTGGMKSKLLAAQTALSLGVKVFVGSGTGTNKLLDIMADRGDGTYIGEKLEPNYRKQKQWITFHSQVAGKINIDEGASLAILNHGKSLLPAGVISVHGSFEAGAVVEVIYKDQIIAKGQVNYSSEEMMKTKGEPSEVAMKLTLGNRPEVIHRDRLVIYQDMIPTMKYKS